MQDLRADVKESNEKYKAITNRLENLEKKVDSNQEVLEGRMSNIETRVQGLESNEVGHDTTILDQRIDELEQRSLNSKAILSLSEPLTVNEAQSGDRTQVVRTHLSQTLNLPLDELSTISAYSFDSEGYTPGCRFAIEFADPAVRPKLFKKFRQIRPSDQFLNDFLTKKRNNVLYGIRKLRERNSEKIKKVFSDFGRLFVVIQGSPRPKLVRTVEEVGALL